MIAWSNPDESAIIEQGTWVVRQVCHRCPKVISRPEMPPRAEPTVRPGFRLPPVNPGKRIKSKKRRRRNG